MILWGILTSVFWALIIAIVLWVLCAFSGKLVNSNYCMPVVQHLVCLVIAIPTVVLLTIAFMCNKSNRLATQVDTYVAKTLVADGNFVEQLRQQVNLAVSTDDAEAVTDYLAQNYAKNISSKYPMLGKYVDVDQAMENMDIDGQLSDISQGVDISKAQQIIKTTAGSFTEGIRSKIKSVRRKALITVLLLQAITFGIVFYQANKYHKPIVPNYLSGSDYF